MKLFSGGPMHFLLTKYVTAVAVAGGGDIRAMQGRRRRGVAGPRPFETCGDHPAEIWILQYLFS